MPDTKTIYIVDDHPVFRKGLGQLLNEETDLTVAGEAESVDQAIDLLEKSVPDLVTVDITLKDRCGLELVEFAKSRYPGLPVLVISMHDESLYAERVLRAGALGYITKQEISASILTAVRQVMAGKRYISPDMMDTLLVKMTAATGPGGDADPVGILSNRELEVFEMMGRGLKRSEIASRLNLSVKTIGTYRDNIKKLNLNSTAELVKHAVVWNEQNR